MNADDESWWHFCGALPLSRDDHAYFVLRRVWADHTMQPPNRGYWARQTEDYVTLALFQPLACLSGTIWLDRLLEAAGLPPVSAAEIRFAFACEEVLDATLRPRHGRGFVIPDIMLTWRNHETGLVAFEVKKPGGSAPSVQDATKLETYAQLPSTRNISDRRGLFLVDDRHVVALKRSGHSAIGWSRVHLALIEGLESETGSPDEIQEIATLLTKLFRMYRVEIRPFGVPRGAGGVLAPRLAALLAGLKVREQALSGCVPTPPFDWLAREPARRDIPRVCFQTTAARRVNRWSFNWEPEHEV
ncbi:MAG: hypothetical protein GW905_13775 [Rhodobacterales bacterium]|nr:hypothetical protein [Rhodobacterales bacterium]